MDQVVESQESARPKSWAADTILRKYLKIEDPDAQVYARENLKAATATFVSRIEHNSERGIRARLLFGFQEAWGGYGLELTEAGLLRKLPIHQFDEAGKPVMGEPEEFHEEFQVDPPSVKKNSLSDWSKMELQRAPSRKPRVNLNPYHCIPMIEELATSMAAAYEHAFSEAAHKAGVQMDPTRGYHPTLMTVARNVVGQRVGKQIMEFRKLLDQGALAIMNRATDQRTDLYAILTAADKDGDKIAQRNRQQACTAYPLLPSLLLSNGAFRDRVDAGAPLKVAISEAFEAQYGAKVPTAVTGRLKGLNWQKTSRAGYKEPMALLQALADTPLNWTPKNRAGWTALQLVWEHAHQRLQDNESQPIQYRNCRSIADFMKVMGPDWTKAAERMNQHAGLGGVDDLKRSLWKQCLQPMATAMAREAADRAGWRSQDPDQPLGDYDTPPLQALDAAKARFETFFTGALTVPQAFELSDSWHERLDTLNAEIHKARSDTGENLVDVRWGKAFPDWTAPGGLTVTMLETEAQLVEEGDRLNHCVGGYASNVTNRGSIILSLRDTQGRSVTTLEVAEEDPQSKTPTFWIRQHYGDWDRRPSAHAAAAAEAWLEAANRGEIAFDRAGHKLGCEIAKSAIARNTSAESEMRPEQRQALWEAHRRFMPKPMRDAASPEAWLAASGATQLIEATVSKAVASEKDIQQQARELSHEMQRARPNREQAVAVQAAPAREPRFWDRAIAVLQRLNPLGPAFEAR